MLLVEFFHNFLDTSAEQRYENQDDKMVMVPQTTRRSRLTLKEINKLRKMKEIKAIETKIQNEFIATMYGQPPQPPGL